MNQIRTNFDQPRFNRNSTSGHYESWFVRANHPHRPLAFWIRYTIFSPRLHSTSAIGEVWAIYFDGEADSHISFKSEFPIQECEFNADPFIVRIGASYLTKEKTIGHADSKDRSQKIEWDLSLSGGSSPVFLFPEKYYDSNFPKAKVLVGRPLAIFNGVLKLHGKELPIENWKGSHNHNWGSRHTDRYAWGQVCGFDGEPDSFLELATAKLKFGPFWTPGITPIVLRFRNLEYTLNEPIKSLFRGSYSYFDWKFSASSPKIRIEGRIHANRSDFACLRYNNPPGGWKYCLNTKLARAELLVTRSGETSPLRLISSRSAAFEILTDDPSHRLQPEV
ncbi:hypothetical protein LEP1GSC050_3870 [Leptospira broomii serovar Hurstbridge str. 5399]|uniref:Tocopherol cyclase n=1 Tax=Leptospira broomii serovar Hurstbridge str. 5399 TaxID=1049789 RepID=T0GKI4_9LEPT|nr:hypothetical protein [Leptospira broomii]EQA45898.1 hypothetical protein LEP1GSC050_3870 [Leptospira broomii serovar Hurstbridge str. 5399]